MSLFNILKSIYNVFCGKPENDNQQKPQQHHQQQPQQGQTHYPPQRPPQQQQHQQQQPHKQQPQQHDQHRPTGQHRPFSDPNQVNQHNEHYVSLRAQANREGDAMARCFQESHEAYSRGDGAKAKELSNEGKEHQRNMEKLNKQASDWIFVENNKDSGPGEIDLHGLYVKEAIAHTDQAIEEAKRRGDSEVRLIVGKGLHSSGGAAKIKPAIEELMQKHRLAADLDPDNAGVLVVAIDSSGSGRGVDPGEISRRLNSKDEGCTIM